MNSKVSKNLLGVEGKIALITGSTRGIGRASAELFLAHGGSVAINGRTEKSVSAAQQEFENAGHAVFGIAADVGDYAAVEKMVEKVLKRFGKIDVLINSAGMAKGGQVEDISETEWTDVLRTNLDGLFHVCKAIVPIMKEQHSGVIVAISSQSIVSSSVAGTHYIASKGGVVAFTRGLAHQVGKFNIRANVVVPGIIETEMTKKNRDRGLYNNILKTFPLGRLGKPEEVAAACLFLVSDASSYITGETLFVNGGLPSMVLI